MKLNVAHAFKCCWSMTQRNSAVLEYVSIAKLTQSGDVFPRAELGCRLYEEE